MRFTSLIQTYKRFTPLAPGYLPGMTTRYKTITRRLTRAYRVPLSKILWRGVVPPTSPFMKTCLSRAPALTDYFRGRQTKPACTTAWPLGVLQRSIRLIIASIATYRPALLTNDQARHALTQPNAKALTNPTVPYWARPKNAGLSNNLRRPVANGICWDNKPCLDDATSARPAHNCCATMAGMATQRPADDSPIRCNRLGSKTR